MIFAYAGRRSPSLSSEAQTLVGERLTKLLTQADPSAVVGAAACGADLILLAEALRLQARNGRPEVHVVLPTPIDRFREESVEPAWRDRFDDAIREVERRGTLEQADGTADDVYGAGNLAILDRAAELARGSGERVVALVVASPGEGTYTTRFVEQAALRDMRELRIDPAITRADQQRCFVVMPYGEKWDAQRGFTMNCDLTYGRLLVPALEHAQLHYRRADETVDPGVVLAPMIDDIARADVVIGDLATGNFNVGWELGLRHLLRDRTTILIKPAGNMPAPFDVQALRTVSYRHDAEGFSDDAVLQAWAGLEPLLARGAGEQKTDSPVVALMDVRLAEVAPLGREEHDVQRLRDALAEARDAADAARVEAVVRDADALEDPDDLRLVRAEAGTILRRLGEYDRARELLEPVVAADPAVNRAVAHQQLAMALYQRKEASADDYARAKDILENVKEHGGYPETDSLLGAVAKRRARLVEGDERRAALQTARQAYLAEYERNLNDHYSGVNVLALDAVLATAFEDGGARDELARLLAAVRVAAQLRLARAPGDYWARASVAEIELLARLTGQGDDDAAFVDAYRHASAARPLPEDLASTRNQLAWYESMGVPVAPLRAAAAALTS